MKIFRIITVALCVMLFFNGCRKEQEEETVRINKEEFSIQDLKMIGEAFRDGILANPETIILDRNEYSPAYEYLEGIYDMLINTDKITNRLNFDWEIYIIHDDDIEMAFAVPGGQMFVYTGMLKHMKSEAELSCILSHELFYTDGLNSVERLKAEYGGQILGDIILGNTVSSLEEMAINMSTLIYSSEEVIEADEFAIDIVCQFNYDGKALKRILDNSGEEVAWIKTRSVMDAEERKNKLLKHTSDCYSSSTYATRYRKFVRDLLPK